VSEIVIINTGYDLNNFITCFDNTNIHRDHENEKFKNFMENLKDRFFWEKLIFICCVSMLELTQGYLLVDTRIEICSVS